MGIQFLKEKSEFKLIHFLNYIVIFILSRYYNKQMNTNIQQKGNKHDVISFTTYIEIDMHGGDSLIGEDIFNWVPIIRDTLFDALQYKIDYVCFIPGKGIHSDFGIPKLFTTCYNNR